VEITVPIFVVVVADAVVVVADAVFGRSRRKEPRQVQL